MGQQLILTSDGLGGLDSDLNATNVALLLSLFSMR